MKLYAIRLQDRSGRIKPVFRMVEGRPAGILTFGSFSAVQDFVDVLLESDLIQDVTYKIMFVETAGCGCESWHTADIDGSAGPAGEVFMCVKHYDETHGIPNKISDDLERGTVPFCVMEQYGFYDLCCD